MYSPKTLAIGCSIFGVGLAAFLAVSQQTSEPSKKSQGSNVHHSPERTENKPAPARVRDKTEQEQDSPDEFRREFAMREDGYRDAAEGIGKVLAKLSTLQVESDREAFIRGAFTRASKLKTEEALKWAGAVPPKNARDTALLTLLLKWSGRNLVEVMSEKSDGIAGTLGRYLLGSGRLAPIDVASFAHQFLSPENINDLLVSAAVEMAKTDPLKAASFGDDLDPQGQGMFQTRFISKWAEADAQAAWAWASKHPSDAREAFQKIILDTDKIDPVLAARFLEEFSLDDGFRAKQLATIGRIWGLKDYDAALHWAESQSDPAEQAIALKGVRPTGPAGIGAAIRESEHGMQIMSVVEGSAASLPGGVSEGDSIISIKTPEGEWVNTDNLPIDEVIGYLRGKADTSVSLMVQGKDEAAPRAVNVLRKTLPK
jgi:hypothetical protein